ncbi:hypothetical protein G6F35_018567 [Rhizopus arrhizus]|nr:hypothetical protein G6F35_018567 [Rhizopus arrhizus]
MGADFFPERAMADVAAQTPISLPVASRGRTLAPSRTSGDGHEDLDPTACAGHAASGQLGCRRADLRAA